MKIISSNALPGDIINDGWRGGWLCIGRSEYTAWFMKLESLQLSTLKHSGAFYELEIAAGLDDAS